MTRHHSRTSKQKNLWQIQEAKAQFSRVIESACEKGYQIITKKGAPVAVIISKLEFDKMIEPEISLLEFFKAAPFPEFELDIKRSKDLPREVDL